MAPAPALVVPPLGAPLAAWALLWAENAALAAAQAPAASGQRGYGGPDPLLLAAEHVFGRVRDAAAHAAYMTASLAPALNALTLPLAAPSAPMGPVTAACAMATASGLSAAGAAAAEAAAGTGSEGTAVFSTLSASSVWGGSVHSHGSNGPLLLNRGPSAAWWSVVTAKLISLLPLASRQAGLALPLALTAARARSVTQAPGSASLMHPDAVPVGALQVPKPTVLDTSLVLIASPANVTVAAASHVRLSLIARDPVLTAAQVALAASALEAAAVVDVSGSAAAAEVVAGALQTAMTAQQDAAAAVANSVVAAAGAGGAWARAEEHLELDIGHLHVFELSWAATVTMPPGPALATICAASPLRTTLRLRAHRGGDASHPLVSLTLSLATDRASAAARALPLRFAAILPPHAPAQAAAALAAPAAALAAAVRSLLLATATAGPVLAGWLVTPDYTHGLRRLVQGRRRPYTAEPARGATDADAPSLGPGAALATAELGDEPVGVMPLDRVPPEALRRFCALAAAAVMTCTPDTTVGADDTRVPRGLSLVSFAADTGVALSEPMPLVAAPYSTLPTPPPVFAFPQLLRTPAAAPGLAPLDMWLAFLARGGLRPLKPALQPAPPAWLRAVFAFQPARFGGAVPYSAPVGALAALPRAANANLESRAATHATAAASPAALAPSDPLQKPYDRPGTWLCSNAGRAIGDALCRAALSALPDGGRGAGAGALATSQALGRLIGFLRTSAHALNAILAPARVPPAGAASEDLAAMTLLLAGPAPLLGLYEIAARFPWLAYVMLLRDAIDSAPRLSTAAAALAIAAPLNAAPALALAHALSPAALAGPVGPGAPAVPAAEAHVVFETTAARAAVVLALCCWRPEAAPKAPTASLAKIVPAVTTGLASPTAGAGSQIASDWAVFKHPLLPPPAAASLPYTVLPLALQLVLTAPGGLCAAAPGLGSALSAASAPAPGASPLFTPADLAAGAASPRALATAVANMQLWHASALDPTAAARAIGANPGLWGGFRSFQLGRGLAALHMLRASLAQMLVHHTAARAPLIPAHVAAAPNSAAVARAAAAAAAAVGLTVSAADDAAALAYAAMHWLGTAAGPGATGIAGGALREMTRFLLSVLPPEARASPAHCTFAASAVATLTAASRAGLSGPLVEIATAPCDYSVLWAPAAALSGRVSFMTDSLKTIETTAAREMGPALAALAERCALATAPTGLADAAAAALGRAQLPVQLGWRSVEALTTAFTITARSADAVPRDVATAAAAAAACADGLAPALALESATAVAEWRHWVESAWRNSTAARPVSQPPCPWLRLAADGDGDAGGSPSLAPQLLPLRLSTALGLGLGRNAPGVFSGAGAGMSLDPVVGAHCAAASPSNGLALWLDLCSPTLALAPLFASLNAVGFAAACVTSPAAAAAAAAAGAAAGLPHPLGPHIALPDTAATAGELGGPSPRALAVVAAIVGRHPVISAARCLLSRLQQRRRQRERERGAVPGAAVRSAALEHLTPGNTVCVDEASLGVVVDCNAGDADADVGMTALTLLLAQACCPGPALAFRATRAPAANAGSGSTAVAVANAAAGTAAAALSQSVTTAAHAVLANCPSALSVAAPLLPALAHVPLVSALAAAAAWRRPSSADAQLGFDVAVCTALAAMRAGEFSLVSRAAGARNGVVWRAGGGGAVAAAWGGPNRLTARAAAALAAHTGVLWAPPPACTAGSEAPADSAASAGGLTFHPLTVGVPAPDGRGGARLQWHFTPPAPASVAVAPAASAVAAATGLLVPLGSPQALGGLRLPPALQLPAWALGAAVPAAAASLAAVARTLRRARLLAVRDAAAVVAAMPQVLLNEPTTTLVPYRSFSGRPLRQTELARFNHTALRVDSARLLVLATAAHGGLGLRLRLSVPVECSKDDRRAVGIFAAQQQPSSARNAAGTVLSPYAVSRPGQATAVAAAAVNRARFVRTVALSAASAAATPGVARSASVSLSRPSGSGGSAHVRNSALPAAPPSYNALIAERAGQSVSSLHARDNRPVLLSALTLPPASAAAAAAAANSLGRVRVGAPWVRSADIALAPALTSAGAEDDNAQNSATHPLRLGAYALAAAVGKTLTVPVAAAALAAHCEWLRATAAALVRADCAPTALLRRRQWRALVHSVAFAWDAALAARSPADAAAAATVAVASVSPGALRADAALLSLLRPSAHVRMHVALVRAAAATALATLAGVPLQTLVASGVVSDAATAPLPGGVAMGVADIMAEPVTAAVAAPAVATLVKLLATTALPAAPAADAAPNRGTNSQAAFLLLLMRLRDTVAFAPPRLVARALLGTLRVRRSPVRPKLISAAAGATPAAKLPALAVTVSAPMTEHALWGLGLPLAAVTRFARLRARAAAPGNSSTVAVSFDSSGHLFGPAHGRRCALSRVQRFPLTLPLHTPAHAAELTVAAAALLLSLRGSCGARGGGSKADGSDGGADARLLAAFAHRDSALLQGSWQAAAPAPIPLAALVAASANGRCHSSADFEAGSHPLAPNPLASVPAAVATSAAAVATVAHATTVTAAVSPIAILGAAFEPAAAVYASPALAPADYAAAVLSAAAEPAPLSALCTCLGAGSSVSLHAAAAGAAPSRPGQLPVPHHAAPVLALSLAAAALAPAAGARTNADSALAALAALVTVPAMPALAADNERPAPASLAPPAGSPLTRGDGAWGPLRVAALRAPLLSVLQSAFPVSVAESNGAHLATAGASLAAVAAVRALAAALSATAGVAETVSTLLLTADLGAAAAAGRGAVSAVALGLGAVDFTEDLTGDEWRLLTLADDCRGGLGATGSGANGAAAGLATAHATNDTWDSEDDGDDDGEAAAVAAVAASEASFADGLSQGGAAPAPAPPGQAQSVNQAVNGSRHSPREVDAEAEADPESGDDDENVLKAAFSYMGLTMPVLPEDAKVPPPHKDDPPQLRGYTSRFKGRWTGRHVNVSDFGLQHVASPRADEPAVDDDDEGAGKLPHGSDFVPGAVWHDCASADAATAARAALTAAALASDCARAKKSESTSIAAAATAIARRVRADGAAALATAQRLVQASALAPTLAEAAFTLSAWAPYADDAVRVARTLLAAQGAHEAREIAVPARPQLPRLPVAPSPAVAAALTVAVLGALHTRAALVQRHCLWLARRATATAMAAASAASTAAVSAAATGAEGAAGEAGVAAVLACAVDVALQHALLQHCPMPAPLLWLPHPALVAEAEPARPACPCGCASGAAAADSRTAAAVAATFHPALSALAARAAPQCGATSGARVRPAAETPALRGVLWANNVAADAPRFWMAAPHAHGAPHARLLLRSLAAILATASAAAAALPAATPVAVAHAAAAAAVATVHAAADAFASARAALSPWERAVCPGVGDDLYTDVAGIALFAAPAGAPLSLPLLLHPFLPDLRLLVRSCALRASAAALVLAAPTAADQPASAVAAAARAGLSALWRVAGPLVAAGVPVRLDFDSADLGGVTVAEAVADADGRDRLSAAIALSPGAAPSASESALAALLLTVAETAAELTVGAPAVVAAVEALEAAVAGAAGVQAENNQSEPPAAAGAASASFSAAAAAAVAERVASLPLPACAELVLDAVLKLLRLVSVLVASADPRAARPTLAALLRHPALARALLTVAPSAAAGFVAASCCPFASLRNAVVAMVDGVTSHCEATVAAHDAVAAYPPNTVATAGLAAPSTAARACWGRLGRVANARSLHQRGSRAAMAEAAATGSAKLVLAAARAVRCPRAAAAAREGAVASFGLSLLARCDWHTLTNVTRAEPAAALPAASVQAHAPAPAASAAVATLPVLMRLWALAARPLASGEAAELDAAARRSSDATAAATAAATLSGAAGVATTLWGRWPMLREAVRVLAVSHARAESKRAAGSLSAHTAAAVTRAATVPLPLGVARAWALLSGAPVASPLDALAEDAAVAAVDDEVATASAVMAGEATPHSDAPARPLCAHAALLLEAFARLPWARTALDAMPVQHRAGPRAARAAVAHLSAALAAAVAAAPDSRESAWAAEAALLQPVSAVPQTLQTAVPASRGHVASSGVLFDGRFEGSVESEAPYQLPAVVAAANAAATSALATWCGIPGAPGQRAPTAARLGTGPLRSVLIAMHAGAVAAAAVVAAEADKPVGLADDDDDDDENGARASTHRGKSVSRFWWRRGPADYEPAAPSLSRPQSLAQSPAAATAAAAAAEEEDDAAAHGSAAARSALLALATLSLQPGGAVARSWWRQRACLGVALMLAAPLAAPVALPAAHPLLAAPPALAAATFAAAPLLQSSTPVSAGASPGPLGAGGLAQLPVHELWAVAPDVQGATVGSVTAYLAGPAALPVAAGAHSAALLATAAGKARRALAPAAFATALAVGAAAQALEEASIGALARAETPAEVPGPVAAAMTVEHARAVASAVSVAAAVARLVAPRDPVPVDAHHARRGDEEEEGAGHGRERFGEGEGEPHASGAAAEAEADVSVEPDLDAMLCAPPLMAAVALATLAAAVHATLPLLHALCPEPRCAAAAAAVAAPAASQALLAAAGWTAAAAAAPVLVPVSASAAAATGAGAGAAGWARQMVVCARAGLASLLNLELSPNLATSVSELDANAAAATHARCALGGATLALVRAHTARGLAPPLAFVAPADNAGHANVKANANAHNDALLRVGAAPRPLLVLSSLQHVERKASVAAWRPHEAAASALAPLAAGFAAIAAAERAFGADGDCADAEAAHAIAAVGLAADAFAAELAHAIAPLMLSGPPQRQQQQQQQQQQREGETLSDLQRFALTTVASVAFLDLPLLLTRVLAALAHKLPAAAFVGAIAPTPNLTGIDAPVEIAASSAATAAGAARWLAPVLESALVAAHAHSARAGLRRRRAAAAFVAAFGTVQGVADTDAAFSALGVPRAPADAAASTLALPPTLAHVSAAHGAAPAPDCLLTLLPLGVVAALAPFGLVVAHSGSTQQHQHAHAAHGARPAAAAAAARSVSVRPFTALLGDEAGAQRLPLLQAALAALAGAAGQAAAVGATDAIVAGAALDNATDAAALRLAAAAGRRGGADAEAADDAVVIAAAGAVRAVSVDALAAASGLRTADVGFTLLEAALAPVHAAIGRAALALPLCTDPAVAALGQLQKQQQQQQQQPVVGGGVPVIAELPVWPQRAGAGSVAVLWPPQPPTASAGRELLCLFSGGAPVLPTAALATTHDPAVAALAVPTQIRRVAAGAAAAAAIALAAAATPADGSALVALAMAWHDVLAVAAAFATFSAVISLAAPPADARAAAPNARTPLLPHVALARVATASAGAVAAAAAPLLREMRRLHDARAEGSLFSLIRRGLGLAEPVYPQQLRFVAGAAITAEAAVSAAEAAASTLVRLGLGGAALAAAAPALWELPGVAPVADLSVAAAESGAGGSPYTGRGRSAPPAAPPRLDFRMEKYQNGEKLGRAWHSSYGSAIVAFGPWALDAAAATRAAAVIALAGPALARASLRLSHRAPAGAAPVAAAGAARRGQYGSIAESAAAASLSAADYANYSAVGGNAADPGRRGAVLVPALSGAPVETEMAAAALALARAAVAEAIAGLATALPRGWV